MTLLPTPSPVPPSLATSATRRARGEEGEALDANPQPKEGTMACTCTPPVKLATLIKHTANSVLKTLDHEAAPDSSEIFGASYHCTGCGVWYVVNIVVTTLPRRDVAPLVDPSASTHRPEGASFVQPFETTGRIP